MKNIAIIGAGLSGTLLVINLLKQESSDNIRIFWIDKESEDTLGPAYSTDEDYLLNVPAERMGAISSDPEHFLKWVRMKYSAAEKGDYLPRKLYRRYVKELLDEAVRNKGEKILVRITGEAFDINLQGECAVISVRGYDNFTADKVVLALGNPPPTHPQTKNREFLNHKKYIRVPWTPDLLSTIGNEDNVFFLGTGQTMVDIAAGLYRKNHKGQMTAISRKGILPMTQKKPEAYPEFYDELKDLTTIESIFRTIRKHISLATEQGMDAREVIDSLRPFTTIIWQKLPAEEKKRFLRHGFRYWEVIRSRIPPESAKIINELISSGQLKIIAGRINDIITEKDQMHVVYKEQKKELTAYTAADFVINCMGPCNDFEQLDQDLVKNLLAKKLIHCDPVHIGVDALPNGTIINEDGSPSKVIYCMGRVLKGILWESIAAPEIRLQAEKLAEILLI